MGLRRSPGDAEHLPPGKHIPGRSPQANKSRNKVNPVVGPKAAGQSLALGSLSNHPESVPQPLDNGPADKDTPFESIIDLSADSPGNGGQKIFPGENRLGTRVHQQKATRPISIFGQPRVKAGLAEQRSLLIPHDSGNWSSNAQEGLRGGCAI